MKKGKDNHDKEVKELKLQKMQASETIRSLTLERENMRENDRIMLNTLDMMKLYVDQVKNNGLELFKCEKCGLSEERPEELKEHMAKFHREKLTATSENKKETGEDEGIIYCCTKC